MKDIKEFVRRLYRKTGKFCLYIVRCNNQKKEHIEKELKEIRDDVNTLCKLYDVK